MLWRRTRLKAHALNVAKLCMQETWHSAGSLFYNLFLRRQCSIERFMFYKDGIVVASGDCTEDGSPVTSILAYPGLLGQ